MNADTFRSITLSPCKLYTGSPYFRNNTLKIHLNLLPSVAALMSRSGFQYGVINVFPYFMASSKCIHCVSQQEQFSADILSIGWTLNWVIVETFRCQA